MLARTKALGEASYPLSGLSVPEPALPERMRTTRHHMDSWSGWPADIDCSGDMLIPSLFPICVLVWYAGLP